MRELLALKRFQDENRYNVSSKGPCAGAVNGLEFSGAIVDKAIWFLILRLLESVID